MFSRSCVISLLVSSVLLSCAPARIVTQDATVFERPELIYVVARAPIPAEVSNQTQAMSLAREAAVTLGQTSLLTYVLDKKARSGKKLAEAEIPYIGLQNQIRGMVQGAVVTKTEYKNEICEVTLAIAKSQVKELLKKN